MALLQRLQLLGWHGFRNIHLSACSLITSGSSLPMVSISIASILRPVSRWQRLLPLLALMLILLLRQRGQPLKRGAKRRGMYAHATCMLLRVTSRSTRACWPSWNRWITANPFVRRVTLTYHSLLAISIITRGGHN